MKQLLFLLLFPCLALAQYQGNGNQKITLGEQTTADGLVWRGIRADTTTKIVPLSDTSAYIILDTVEKTLWLYKAGQIPKWQQVGGSAGGSVTSVAALTLGTSGADLNSTVANSTTTPVITLNVPNASASNRGVITTGTQTIAGAKTFSNAATFTSGLISNGVNPFGSALYSNNASSYTTFQSYLSNSRSWQLDNVSNEFWLYLDGNVDKYVLKFLQTSGNAEFGSAIIATTGTFTNYAGGGTTSASIDNNGQIVRTSSIELKKDIIPINYGLNEILKINPINFNWIDEDKFGNENENGFIAEDVMSIIPNVVAADTHGLFMDYTKLIPILTKAIQEQQAIIKALEQRIINLENK